MPARRVAEYPRFTGFADGKAAQVIVILLFSLVGIAGSCAVAWFGIRVNTFANSQTAFAVLRGKPFPCYAIPLKAGMSIGMLLISVELLLMLGILLFIPGNYAGACFIGFAIGESLGASALRIVFSTLAFAFHDSFFFIGNLIAIAIFGLFQALFMANAGGAWDNAKKIVEVERKMKGTPLHDASVVGDTVGDPFKDTSSVALDPVIKLTTLFGLLAVELASPEVGADATIRVP